MKYLYSLLTIVVTLNCSAYCHTGNPTASGDAIYEDEGEWCENHCGENNLCEECYRHFLLGE